jgi:hypothetical protein
MALVFSKGEWITVTLPPDHETWSFSDQILYGTTYAFATREKYFQPDQASQIAEAVVFKRLYPGMMMRPEIEHLLQYLYDF